MSRVSIETNGSAVENLLRDHLRSEIRDVEGEIVKADAAGKTLRERLAFLKEPEQKAVEHGVELRGPSEAPPPVRLDK